MDRPESDTLHGVVVNSVTHKAIGRALVLSTDNRYAAMTDDRDGLNLRFHTQKGNRARALATL
jgi:hypothetical protein